MSDPLDDSIKHTPTPWAMKSAVNGIDRDFGIYREGHAGVLAECFEEFRAKGDRRPEEAAANAEYIVRACNAHEDLVLTAKLLLARMIKVDAWMKERAALEAAIAKAEGRG